MDKTTHIPLFLKLSRKEQKLSLETLIFSSEEPINEVTLRNILISLENDNSSICDNSDSEIFNNDDDNLPLDNQLSLNINFFSNLIDEINNDLLETNRPYSIVKLAGSWQFATRSEYGHLICQLNKSKIKKRLTQASLEVLSIIAYNHSITRPEIEQIRGVKNSDVINTLLEKNFIEVIGRKDTLGKPLMYGTTVEFLRAFGLNSIDELPKLHEFDDNIEDSDYKSFIELSVNERLNINNDINSLPSNTAFNIEFNNVHNDIATDNQHDIILQDDDLNEN